MSAGAGETDLVDAGDRYVVITGELLPGRDEAVTRRHLSRFLKVSGAALADLLDGESRLVAGPVMRDEAERYRGALEKAGIRCHVGGAPPPPDMLDVRRFSFDPYPLFPGIFAPNALQPILGEYDIPLCHIAATRPVIGNLLAFILAAGAAFLVQYPLTLRVLAPRFSTSMATSLSILGFAVVFLVAYALPGSSRRYMLFFHPRDRYRFGEIRGAGIFGSWDGTCTVHDRDGALLGRVRKGRMDGVIVASFASGETVFTLRKISRLRRFLREMMAELKDNYIDSDELGLVQKLGEVGGGEGSGENEPEPRYLLFDGGGKRIGVCRRDDKVELRLTAPVPSGADRRLLLAICLVFSSK